MGDEAIREACAAVQHEIWSHWMKYLFAQCESVEGGWLIPSDKATQQVQQMNTPYGELSEDEKERARHQADKILNHCDLRVWYN